MTTTLEKFPAEAVLFDLRCKRYLADSETISGTPAMSFLPALTGGDAITFGVPVVNTSAITYDDGTDPAGTVIQVRISGGSIPADADRRSYAVLATFTTNQGNTLIARGLLDVVSTAVPA